jgi:hypothetical protein
VCPVGTSHSATGANESALKYVSPDDHWIARRLATAGGKRIKTRPLSTIATSTTSYRLLPVMTSHYYIQETTARLHIQRPPAGKRPEYLPNEHRTCTSLAGRCKSPQCWIHVCHNTPATQRRSARPTTHSLPAESSRCHMQRPLSGPSTQAVPVSCLVLRSGSEIRHKTHLVTFPHWWPQRRTQNHSPIVRLGYFITYNKIFRICQVMLQSLNIP